MTPPASWPAILWVCGLVLSGVAAAPPEPRGRRSIESFDYQGIRFEPGRVKSQVDEVRQFYLAIPNDDLLKGFRSRAGLPSPGKDLGGWYSGDVFLIFGQIVSGLSRLYAATGDIACRDKANYLVSEWAKCIEPDGYFYASRKPNAPHYIYDKMLWGLLDVTHYCHNQDALMYMSRITDWAIKNLERSRRVNDTSTEWYTLSENLYRAYLATGDKKYRDFAELWEYHDYWDIYARGDDIFAARPDGSRSEAYHAYSHVNTLGSAGAGFLVKGEPHYLQTLLTASAYLQREQCFATGGFGPDEQLLPPGRLLEKLGDSHNTFETQCGCWAVFKLAKYLISFTGDASYGDWVERLLVNGLGASIPMTSDGHVFYYSDYCLYGGTKRNTDFGWSCCTGTRPQAVADCLDLIYFHDAQNLYVNLFTPSAVNWRIVGESVVHLTQTTAFPESDEVQFNIELREPAQFGIKFRVPGWLAAPLTATINGASTKPETDDKHWSTVRRTWKNGDKINLRLPMRLWTSPLDPGRATPAAVLVGPVVLAFEAPDARTLQQVKTSDLEKLLRRQATKPLCFSAEGYSNIQARPFYTLHEGEPYFIYLDPKMGMRISHRDVKFTGKWNGEGAFRFSNEIDAAAECEFEGQGIRWLGRRFDDAGRAEISIDGRVVGVADQYGPGRDLPFDWTHTGLPPGRHTLRLRLLPDAPEKSKDRFLNVIGFEILTNRESSH